MIEAALNIALGYIRRGWNPVPVPFKTKGPQDPGWGKHVIDEASAPRYFNGGPMNVGVILGPTSHGMTDVDLDCIEALAIAPYILPPTKALFGRASKRASHWLYYTDLSAIAEKAAITFDDPKRPAKEGRLVELRIGGDSAAQTIFPGSVHKSGEAITWEETGDPASIDGEELRRQVAALAALCLLARYWPAEGSGHHDAARVVGGFLSRAGQRPEAVRVLVEAIARAAHSARWQELRRTAEDAARAHRDGRHAFGLTGLREAFGIEVADKCAEWLGYRRSGESRPEPQRQEEQDQTKPLIQSSAQFVKDFVPPDYLIDGLLQRRFCYSFTARTGGGKTAIVLLFAALVGLGQKLGDREVGKGRALILAGENPDDVRMRWIGMAQQMGFDENAIEVHFISPAHSSCPP